LKGTLCVSTRILSDQNQSRRTRAVI
jgi:hypothetical protein